MKRACICNRDEDSGFLTGLFGRLPELIIFFLWYPFGYCILLACLGLLLLPEARTVVEHSGSCLILQGARLPCRNGGDSAWRCGGQCSPVGVLLLSATFSNPKIVHEPKKSCYFYFHYYFIDILNKKVLIQRRNICQVKHEWESPWLLIKWIHLIHDSRCFQGRIITQSRKVYPNIKSYSSEIIVS